MSSSTIPRTTSVDSSSLLHCTASNRPYLGRVMNQCGGVFDHVEREKLNELDDAIVLGLPWESQELVNVQALLRKRNRTKVKFFVGIVVVLVLSLLSLPVMMYAVDAMDNFSRALQICGLLGSLDVLSFIIVLGMGYRFKHLDHELQIQVARKMRERGISDPVLYAAMNGDDEHHSVV